MRVRNKIQIVAISSLMFLGMALASFDFSQAQLAKQLDVTAYVVSNDQGKEITNGEYQVRFALYTADRTTMDPYPSNADAGRRIWEEVQTVAVQDGQLSAYLGAVNSLPTGLDFSKSEMYLGVRINSDSEMVPRKKIAAVPLAMNAYDALLLQGAGLGSKAGDIPQLGKGGKINIKNLPTGTNSNQLVLGNDSRLKNSHAQNSDTGTKELEFNLGSTSVLGANNFALTVSNGNNKPALRFNAALGAWQFSNDGVTFSGIGAGASSSIIDLEYGGLGQDVSAFNGLVKIAGGSVAQIADNSANWNTAYGWGNHGAAGYITDGNTNWDNSYGFITSADDSVSGTELDGVFSSNGILRRTGAGTYGVVADNSVNWNTAFGWGNHATAGYLTAETDPIFAVSAAVGIAGTDIANWNTAFGWGNHGAAGYITDGNTNWDNSYGFITASSSETLLNKTWNGNDLDISDYTNLAVSGSLLQLTGDTLSVKEGTLTDTRICTYSSVAGIVCDTTAGSVGATYTAGSGMTLTGTAFDLGGALTGNAAFTGAFDLQLGNIASELKIMGGAGTYYGIFDVDNLATADRTYTFPDKDGTVAMMSDLTGASHNAVTLGTANGLSLVGQQLSLGLASAGVTGALSGADWSTFNSKVSSQWVTTGTDIYYTTGNVGIGTNNPRMKLHLVSGATGTMGFPYEAAVLERNGDTKFGVYTSAAAVPSSSITLGATRYTMLNGRYPGAEIQNVMGTTMADNYIHFNFLGRDSGGNVAEAVVSAFKVTGGGKAGFGIAGMPTASLQIKAGTSTAETAPLKFTAGTNMTTAEAGAFEYDGSELYFTPSGTTRETIAYMSDLTGASHNAVTLGTANGLSLVGQQLSLGLASAGVTGALSGADWSTFNSKVSSQWVTTGTDIYYTTGNVGIGTNNPAAAPLVIYASADMKARFQDAETGASAASFFEFGQTSAGSWQRTGWIGDGSGTEQLMEVGTDSTYPIVFRPGASEAMRILPSGHIGIGNIAAPNAFLQIRAGSVGAGFDTAPLKLTAGTNTPTAQAGAFEYDGSELYFTPSGTTRETIAYMSDLTGASHNAVTLGTANGLSLVGQQLSLGLASAGVTGALSGADWSTFNSKVSSQWVTTGTDIYYTTGNVGIGVSSPSELLDINGNMRFRGGYSLSFDVGGVAVDAYPLAINTYVIPNVGWFYRGNGPAALIASINGEWNFYTANSGLAGASLSGFTEKFTIKNDGKVGIGGVTSPTAFLQIQAGSGGFGADTAPLKLTAGTNTTTAQAGAFEYDGTELYFTPSGTTRETFAFISDITGAAHNAVTLGTANGLSLVGQQLSLGLASAGVTGALSGADWSTFNSKENALTFSSGLTRLVNTITNDLITGIVGGQTIVGSTSTNSGLILKATTGVGTTGADIVFQVGNNGATEAMRILNSGNVTVGGGALAYDAATGTTSVDNLSLGSMNFDTDAGVVTWVDMQVLSAANDAIESYTAQLDGNPMLTIFGKSDGAGGTKNLGVGILMDSPTAYLQIKAGTATAGTAPLKLTAGTNLTTAEAGAFEYDGTELYFTPSGTTRETVAYVSDIPSSHDSVTLGTANGLSLVDQQLSLGLASGSTTGALSSSDWNTFNNKVSSQWVTTGNDIYYNTGNVGINSLTPAGNLDIRQIADGNDVIYARRFTDATPTGNFLRFQNAAGTLDLLTFSAAGDLNIGGGALAFDASTGTTTVDNLNLGSINFDTDAGIVSWVDMPIATSTAGIAQSYTAQLDGNPMLTIYGLTDGAGGVNSSGVGIGTITPTAGLDVAISSVAGIKSRGTLTGGTSLAGISAQNIFAADVTGTGAEVSVTGGNAAAVYTLSNAMGMAINDWAKGAGSTITSQYGLRIYDQTQGASNYGLVSGVSSGTNKWNIYANGTADNYFAGNVGMRTTTPGALAIQSFSGLDVRTAGAASEQTALYLQNSDNTADLLGAVAIEMTPKLTGRRGAKLVTGREGTYAGAATADSYFAIYTAMDDVYQLGLYQNQAGRVGIGDATPLGLLTVGNGDLFQVSATGIITAPTTSTINGLDIASGSNLSVGISTLGLNGDADLLSFASGALTINGDASLTGKLSLMDDQLIVLGTSADSLITHRATVINANTAVSGLIVGTPSVGAIPTNSTLFSNITAGGDMVFLANIGGNSTELLRLDGTSASVDIGAGATAMSIDNAGNVGIGMAPTTSILSILGTDMYLAGSAAPTRHTKLDLNDEFRISLYDTATGIKKSEFGLWDGSTGFGQNNLVSGKNNWFEVFPPYSNGGGQQEYAFKFDIDMSDLNTAGDGYTALFLNVNDALAGADGPRTLMDLQLGSVSKFAVRSNGDLYSSGGDGARTTRIGTNNEFDIELIDTATGFAASRMGLWGDAVGLGAKNVAFNRWNWLEMIMPPSDGAGQVSYLAKLDLDASELNTAGDGYTGLVVDVADAQAGADGLRELMDLQLDGNSQFIVKSDGSTGIGGHSSGVYVSNFSGSVGSLKDMVVGGNIVVNSEINYTVSIDGVGATDTFAWSDGVSGESAVAITAGVPYNLSNGVTITFANNTGHLGDEAWSFNVKPFSLMVYGDQDFSFSSTDGGQLVGRNRGNSKWYLTSLNKTGGLGSELDFESGGLGLWAYDTSGYGGWAGMNISASNNNTRQISFESGSPIDGSGQAETYSFSADYSNFNSSGDGYTALKLNVTDAQAGADGLRSLLDLQTDSVSKFAIRSNGDLYSSGGDGTNYTTIGTDNKFEMSLYNAVAGKNVGQLSLWDNSVGMGRESLTASTSNYLEVFSPEANGTGRQPYGMFKFDINASDFQTAGDGYDGILMNVTAAGAGADGEKNLLNMVVDTEQRFAIRETGGIYMRTSNDEGVNTNYGAYLENLATNTTTDAIDKYGAYITSTGDFTGSTGTATNNYGLYIATTSGGDNNYDLYAQSGANLSTAGTFNNAPSYRKYKGEYTSTESYLDKLMTLDVFEWQYKNQTIDGMNRYADDPNRHASPFLDDFYNTFHLGTIEGYNIQDLAGVTLASVKELNSRFLEQKDTTTTALADLNLKTINDSATVAELRSSVYVQLGILNQSVVDQEARLATQETLAATMQAQIAELQRISTPDLATKLAQVDLNTTEIDYIKMVLGLDTKVAGDVNPLGKLEADGVVAGAFAVKVSDTDRKTIGVGVICPAMKEMDVEEKCTITQVDSDADGVDDNTGNPISDGQSVEVATKAVSEASKIFTNFENNPGAYNWVEKVKKDGEFTGFVIKLSGGAADDIKVNWWIVEEK